MLCGCCVRTFIPLVTIETKSKIPNIPSLPISFSQTFFPHSLSLSSVKPLLSCQVHTQSTHLTFFPVSGNVTFTSVCDCSGGVGGNRIK